MILRAKWVLPVSLEPIEQGEVVVVGDRIAEVRRQTETVSGDDVRDFGDAILMPGMVNVHAHLEYTGLRGQVKKTPFFAWLRALVELKAQTPPEKWIEFAKQGAAECLVSGITTVSDNTDSGVTVEALAQSGLRGRVYQEVFSLVSSQTDEQILEELKEKLDHHDKTLRKWEASERVSLGISPHATYTVRDSLLRKIAVLSKEQAIPLSIHAAESSSEIALTRSGSGEFADLFHERGIDYTAPRMNPIEYLKTTGIMGERTQLVHCVRAEPHEIQMMAETGCSAAHCPRSNANLLSGIAPLQEMLRLGVRVGLGTDSVVSSGSLDMFEEMRCAMWLQRAGRYASIPGSKGWVEMATIGGAASLGMETEIGSLEPGKKADLCVVRTSRSAFSGVPDPYTALVSIAYATDVCFTMVDGKKFWDNKSC
jgi:cytosine/adenosine deaminase-related metal-dependent hydrolase